MKALQRYVSLLIILFCTHTISANFIDTIFSYIFVKETQVPRDTSWTIVGAGPAGITVVGLLLDLGINPEDITWIDPEFNVGRLSMYGSVPANTMAKLFVNFIQSCKTFRECKTQACINLCNYDQEKECPLQMIVDPLQDITNYLCTKVHAVKGSITSLDFEDNSWLVSCNKGYPIRSEHVVLATGSHPKSLNYKCDYEIPLDIALNKELLAKQVNPQDSIAVVGGAHSAILVLKFLTEMKVKRIVNFYKEPLQYAIDMSTLVLYNANGIQGVAARWALDVLEKNPPANLLRIKNSPESLDAWLPVCNKIIYAVGYERNELPPINGSTQITYDGTSGVIAPRLFGIGIAFPEEYTYPDGKSEFRVGLHRFMDYAQRVIPHWMATKDIYKQFSEFEQLFMINIL